MKNFSLENFEGPIELLLYLIQKQELEICDILLKKLTEQFFTQFSQDDLESGAEFLGISSTLLLMKSRQLLPTEQPSVLNEDEIPKWELFQQLYEYCKFKQLAETLQKQEENQAAFFSRPLTEIHTPKATGLDYLELKDLTQLLQELLAKIDEPIVKIHEEQWYVSDKIASIKDMLNDNDKILLSNLLHIQMTRAELIVTFLAILELMKNQQLLLIKEESEMYATRN